MARKRFTVEQIINHLREADVWLAQRLIIVIGKYHFPNLPSPLKSPL